MHVQVIKTPKQGMVRYIESFLLADKTQKIDDAEEILEYILANGGVWMQGKQINLSYLLMDSGSE